MFARFPLVLAMVLAAVPAAANPPTPPPPTDGHGVMQRVPPEDDLPMTPPSMPPVIAPNDGLIERHGRWMKGDRRATRAEIALHFKHGMMSRRMGRDGR